MGAYGRSVATNQTPCYRDIECDPRRIAESRSQKINVHIGQS